MNKDENPTDWAADDDLPEPGPAYADTLFTDQYGVTYHCLYKEEAGWAWEAV